MIPGVDNTQSNPYKRTLLEELTMKRYRVVLTTPVLLHVDATSHADARNEALRIVMEAMGNPADQRELCDALRPHGSPGYQILATQLETTPDEQPGVYVA